MYADTISDLGFAHELANYGEYSGAPSTEHTFEYAKTLIELMTREKDPRGKILIIGGGIANFTDVAATFKGLIKAMVAFQDTMRAHNVSRLAIWNIMMLVISYRARTRVSHASGISRRSKYMSVVRVPTTKKRCK